MLEATRLDLWSGLARPRSFELVFQGGPIVCSWRRPRRATRGARNRCDPFGRTSHDQFIRVDPLTSSNVNPPSTSAEDIVVREPNLLGLWYSVTSMSISISRRPDCAVARNRVPTPIGPSVIFSECNIRGL